MVDSQLPTDQYQTLLKTAEALAEQLCAAVVTPIAKQQFKTDRGVAVRKVLPDRTDEYEFAAQGFSALVRPDERTVVNHSYSETVLTADAVMQDPEWCREVVTQAEALWREVFGEPDGYVTQPKRPGEFPMGDAETEQLLTTIDELHTSLTAANSLPVVIEAARNDHYRLLADIFGTTREEILTPGGTDLAALPRSDTLHVPYNDGEIAVIRPTTTQTAGPGRSRQRRRERQTPTRGVVIGHDDTPVGIFAHTIDVTDLDPAQDLDRETIRAAMGFDRELDPWDLPETLDLDAGEQVRVQGDLRVERRGTIDEFPAELARRERIQRYRDGLSEILTAVTLPSQFVRGQETALPVRDVVEPVVSPTGSITLNPTTDDPRLELLAYVTLLRDETAGPAGNYDTYSDIPYIEEPSLLRWTFAQHSTEHAITQAQNEVLDTLQATADTMRDDVNAAARETAAEVEAALDAPRQVNLPVDNHLAFIEAGYAPDEDTEPIPVAVPDETTLHIEHAEHNAVTVQIPDGVYRFSLLPRGLQPPADRPSWPTP